MLPGERVVSENEMALVTEPPGDRHGRSRFGIDAMAIREKTM